MNEHEPFSDSIYDEQAHLAGRELSSFIAAVKELYGPEQAMLSAEDWLDESDLIDRPPGSEVRDWRAVTIAASARLANRVNVRAVSRNVSQHTSTTNMKVPPTPSSNCFDLKVGKNEEHERRVHGFRCGGQSLDQHEADKVSVTP